MNYENNFNPDEKYKKIYFEIAEITIVESMKHNIAEFGSDEVFRLIEQNIHNAKSRLRYRKYFLLAGGQIPETEV